MDSPIFQHLYSIIESINSSLITQVIAPTGSGIGTGIPALFQQAAPDSSIEVVCLNDCSAKLWYHQYQLANPGSSAGYATLQEQTIQEDTKIHFVTRDYLMHQVLTSFTNGERCETFDHPLYVFETVDEATIEQHVILAMWRFCIQEGGSAARLVLVSETEDGLKIPVIKDVESVSKVYRINNQKMDTQIKRNDRFTIVQDDAVYDEMATEAINYCDSRQPGSMLVIVPSSAEVELMAIKLKNLEAVLIPVTMDADFAELAHLIPLNTNKRKVYLVASDCETAMSVPDVSIVIDSMRRTNGCGQMTFVNKSEAYRRKNYTSRTLPGIWVTMANVHKMRNSPKYPRYNGKQVDRVILQLLAADISPVDVFGESIIDREEIAMQFNDEERAFASHFPIDMRLAVLIYRWAQAQLPLFPVLLAVAVIDQYGTGLLQLPRRNPKDSNTQHRNKMEEFKAQYYHSYRGNNDVETTMKIILHLMAQTEGFKLPVNLVDWCRQHGIHHDQLQKMLTMLDRLVGIVPGKVAFGPFNTGNMMNAFRPMVADIYRSDILTRSHRGYVTLDTKENYSLSDHFGYSNLRANNPNTIVPLIMDRRAMKFSNVRNAVLLAIDLPKVGIKSTPKVSASVQPTSTFNVNNLSVELQEIWHENKHAHQAIYNANEFPAGDWQVLRANRELEMNDRMAVPGTTPELSYRDKEPGEYRTVEFWSDRRSLISVAEFLTYYGNRSTTVVWAGARGTFFAKLADMFPHHTFHVYVRDTQPTDHERVHTYIENFSTVEAEKYAGQSVIFLSDGRRIKQTDTHDVNLDTVTTVMDDMDRQKLWVTIIEPSISMLKFRLPYTSGTSSYFHGTMWLQPWGPATSTETYLIFEGISKLRDYDHDQINNLMYWHNTVQRTTLYQQSERRFGLDSCYDCSTEQFILRMYNETYKKNITSGDVTDALGTRSL